MRQTVVLGLGLGSVSSVVLYQYYLMTGEQKRINFGETQTLAQ